MRSLTSRFPLRIKSLADKDQVTKNNWNMKPCLNLWSESTLHYHSLYVFLKRRHCYTQCGNMDEISKYPLSGHHVNACFKTVIQLGQEHYSDFPELQCTKGLLPNAGARPDWARTRRCETTQHCHIADV